MAIRVSSNEILSTLARRRRTVNVGKAIYGLRNRVERFCTRPKNARRIAIRYDKRIGSFRGFGHSRNHPDLD